MAQEGKKISFGFSKTLKKPDLKPQVVPEKKVDYIECVDEKSIKVIGKEEKKDEPLVIPMLGSKSWHDRIINKVNADIYGDPKKDKNKKLKIKQEPDEKSNDKIDNSSAEEVVNNDSLDAPATESLSLEERAAQEIINDLKKDENKLDKNGVNLVIEQNSNLAGEKESSLENYDEIPIEKFGMAMLRGMGWEPDKGIGKNAQVVSAAIPTLRPKGIGLGADKVIQQIKNTKQSGVKTEEKLKLVKGAFVKITAGKESGNYGIVEGFDDELGRTIIKPALSNEVISLNDFVVVPVTKEEYDKNSRVLNNSKYEKYKDQISSKETNNEKHRSSASDSEDEKTRNESKKSKNHKKSRRKNESRCEHTSDSESDSDSSDSDEKYSRKNKYEKSSDKQNNHYKSKKSKNSSKRRDNSSRRRENSETRKKSNKSQKKSSRRREESNSHNYKDEKKKHRKHKRSRSRSRSRSGRR